MARKHWFFYAMAGMFTLLLSACASPVMQTLADEQVWQDATFNSGSVAVTESPASIFALDAELLDSLRATVPSKARPEDQVKALLAHLYGSQGIRLSYSVGHSTDARQTWRNQTGDCLSLTILAYAAAKAMGLPARMQEVAVPPLIDRRAGVDYAVGHVNVIVPLRQPVVLNGRTFESSYLVIDFEPQAASFRRGNMLSETAVVARFYNNRASEYWVQGDKARAYAYFKAALQADPSFGPAYSNLAMLYTRHDLWQPAEVLLRHALALSDAMDAPLLALHRLLIRQGRPEEAKAMEVEIQSRQARNPYFWLAKGQSYLLKQEYRDAIQALERALELSNGFVEVHAHLALAYWYDGQRQQAEAQIKQLQVLPRSESILALLNRKLAATH